MELKAVADVDAAFRQLDERLQRGAKVYDFTLITPTGSVPCKAYWHQREGIWAVLQLDEEQGKYWCSYGLQDPAQAPAQTFVCQINLQRTGNLWRTAGALAADTSDRLYYVHSGLLGGSGLAFARWYHGPQATITWSETKKTTPFVVGRLDDRHFVEHLATYAKAIKEFKGGGRQESQDNIYRNAITLGVTEAIQDVQSLLDDGDDTRTGRNVAPIRLERLQQLQKWLQDDPEMLQTTVDKLTGKAEADRRKHVMVSVGAAGISIVTGWLLSAVSPATLLAQLAGHLAIR